MKKQMILAMMASVAILAACSDDDNGSGNPGPGPAPWASTKRGSYSAKRKDRTRFTT